MNKTVFSEPVNQIKKQKQNQQHRDAQIRRYIRDFTIQQHLGAEERHANKTDVESALFHGAQHAIDSAPSY